MPVERPKLAVRHVHHVDVLANLLDDYQQNVVTRDDYFRLLKIYAKWQHRRREDAPWCRGSTRI